MFILNPFKPPVLKVNDTAYSHNYTQQEASFTRRTALPFCGIRPPPPARPKAGAATKAEVLGKDGLSQHRYSAKRKTPNGWENPVPLQDAFVGQIPEMLKLHTTSFLKDRKEITRPNKRTPRPDGVSNRD